MKKLIALAAAALFCIGAGIEFCMPKEDTFGMNTRTEDGVVDNAFYWSANDESMDAATIYRLTNGTDPSMKECETEAYTPKRYTGSGWAAKDPYWFALKSTASDADAAEFNVDFGFGVNSSGTGLTDGAQVVSVGTSPNTVHHITHNTDADATENVYLASAEGTPLVFYRPKSNPGSSNQEDTEIFLRYGATYQAKQLADGETYFITAPQECTLKTSHFACENGRKMQVEYEILDNTGSDGPTQRTVLMEINNARCWWCCRNKISDADIKEGKSCKEVDIIEGIPYYKANCKDSMKGRQIHAGNLLVVATKDTTVKFSLVS